MATVYGEVGINGGASMSEGDAELEAHARAAIERDKLDPRQQQYLVNATTGRLIRTNEQYHRAVENQHGFKTISYNAALELSRQEDAAKKAALREHARKQAVKKSRKRNRKK